MRRREFIVGLGGAATWPVVALGQPVMPVIGWLGRTNPQTTIVAAFRPGLQETGFIENQNVAVEYRWADGQDNRLASLAADLVNRRVALIAAITANSAVVAKA